MGDRGQYRNSKGSARCIQSARGWTAHRWQQGFRRRNHYPLAVAGRNAPWLWILALSCLSDLDYFTDVPILGTYLILSFTLTLSVHPYVAQVIALVCVINVVLHNDNCFGWLININNTLSCSNAHRVIRSRWRRSGSSVCHSNRTSWPSRSEWRKLPGTLASGRSPCRRETLICPYFRFFQCKQHLARKEITFCSGHLFPEQKKQKRI